MEFTKEIQGKKYRYLKIGSESGRNLLILGGFSSFKECAANVLAKYFPDHRVLVPEYPYHNGFDDVELNITSVKDLAEYLKPLLKAEGFMEIDALGFSLGGLILSELLNNFEELKVNKAVIWASPVLGTKGLADMSQLLAQVYLRTPDDRILKFQKNRLLRKILLIKGIKPFHPAKFKKYLNIFESYQLDHLRPDCRYLFIYDPRDILVPIVNCNYVKEKFGQEGVQVEVFPGGGHFGTKSGWITAVEKTKNFLNN